MEVPKPFPGHSVSLQMLGSFILWFGWFGFNPGTALLLGDNVYQAEIGALCAVNTFLASAGGCVSALILKMLIRHRATGEFSFDLVSAMNGTLTGLVSVSAAPACRPEVRNGVVSDSYCGVNGSNDRFPDYCGMRYSGTLGCPCDRVGRRIPVFGCF